MQTMKSCLLPLLVAVVVLPKPAVLTRIRNTVDLQASTSSDESEDAFDSHAHVVAQSEATQDLQNFSYARLIEAFHTNLSAAAWPLEQHDAMKIQGVLNIVNGDRSDTCEWTWSDADPEWTFPFTMKTAQPTAERALALHMLHRHGLAPLAASKHQAAFKKFHRELVDRSTNGFGGSINDFVLELENFPLIKDLFAKLSDMSLGGLRNVHSFDHDFSTKTNGGSGCNHGRNPEECMLQASYSLPTRWFMDQYGFTDDTKLSLIKGYHGYTDQLWYAPSFSARQNLFGDRLKLWAYEEADFFSLLSPHARMEKEDPLSAETGLTLQSESESESEVLRNGTVCCCKSVTNVNSCSKWFGKRFFRKEIGSCCKLTKPTWTHAAHEAHEFKNPCSARKNSRTFDVNGCSAKDSI